MLGCPYPALPHAGLLPHTQRGRGPGSGPAGGLPGRQVEGGAALAQEVLRTARGSSAGPLPGAPGHPCRAGLALACLCGARALPTPRRWLVGRRAPPPPPPAPPLQPAKDAVDTMVLNAANLAALDAYTMLDHQPFDPTIKRTESVGARVGGGRVQGSQLRRRVRRSWAARRRLCCPQQ